MKLKNRKTGEIVELKLIQVNDKYLEDHEVDLLNGEKLTLKSLADSFDDVKEPLIKATDVRYILGQWASTNHIPSNSNEIEVCLIDSQKGTITQFYSDGLYIQFWGKVAPDAISGRCYTIDKLCGEEE